MLSGNRFESVAPTYDLGMSITREPEDAVAWLAQVTDLLGRLNQVPLWKIANDQTLELLRSYLRATSMLAVGMLKAIAEVDARGTALAVN